MGLALILDDTVFGKGGGDILGSSVSICSEIGFDGLRQFDAHLIAPIFQPYQAAAPILRWSTGAL
jgi:hypothetical protein